MIRTHALRPSLAGILVLGLVHLAAAVRGDSIAGPGIGGAPEELPRVTPGLYVTGPGGEPGDPCPLERTAVHAEVSGWIARVEVTQVFRNTRPDRIEAIYSFPLSQKGAVDDMVLRTGGREIRAEIRRREEAREIYDEARRSGHVAALLDQERPNIFTQSVANIEPGARVEVTIRYVEPLAWEAGEFTFVFPATVGPRYVPGGGRVPDAGRITPPVAAPGTRAGHDLAIEVVLDAGARIGRIDSKIHEIEVLREDAGRAAVVSLRRGAEVPNRDFVLTWSLAGEGIRSGFLTHREGPAGTVAVLLVPPSRPEPAQIAPREMIFVVDRSGSQQGLPIGKAKETLLRILDWMGPQDTFQLIDFSNRPHVLFDRPLPATGRMIQEAREYIATIEGNGGTEMAAALREACAQPAEAHRLRIVTLMTDGYIGDDHGVLDLVRTLRGRSRWFPFGTGNSVNRYLLDNMARLGGGEAEYVLLNRPAEEVARRFWERIDSPVLTDIQVDWGGLPVEEVFPAEMSDLWSEKPLLFLARVSGPARGTVTVRGWSGGRAWEASIPVAIPAREEGNAVLDSLWARAKVDSILDQDLPGLQAGSFRQDLREEVVALALGHRLMTPFTSFVAVDRSRVTSGPDGGTVEVPVELADGSFGSESEVDASGVRKGGVAGGVVGGVVGGVQGGTVLYNRAVERKKESSRSAASPPSGGFELQRGGAAQVGQVGTGLAKTDESVRSRPQAPRLDPGVGSAAPGKDRDGGAPGDKAAAGDSATPDPWGRGACRGKLDPVLARLAGLGAPGAVPEEIVPAFSEGRVRVKLRLADSSVSVLRALSAAGLRIERLEENSWALGWIEPGRLPGLCEVAAVDWIAPAPAEDR